MQKTPIVLFWFRRDLRLHDNCGLWHALKSGLPVLPVFIFDRNILQSLPVDDARVSFIHQTLSGLDAEFRKHDSSIHVLRDTPADAFKKLCDSFDVKAVYTNHDYEPYAIERDAAIKERLQKKGISFHSYKDQVIFEKNEVLKADGKPYTVFTPYSRLWKQKLDEIKLTPYPSEKHLSGLLQLTSRFPSLSEIGFRPSSIHVPNPVIDKNVIINYHNTRNIPSVAGTTRLSVHLRFGTVSIRSLVTVARELNTEWLNELIWREFFMMILLHFPHVVTHSFKPKYDNIVWRNDDREFERWCKGETGYPIVDAGMRELNATGFMHNRVRMITASFLTKHLLIDWRRGEAYFAEKLLDYELASNNGNWQWAAGSGCDAAPYFRIFNPSEQTKRFDPQQLYIKQWLGDPDRYDFLPIVEHTFARNRALSTFKKYLGGE